MSEIHINPDIPCSFICELADFLHSNKSLLVQNESQTAWIRIRIRTNPVKSRIRIRIRQNPLIWGFTQHYILANNSGGSNPGLGARGLDPFGDF
jgi:hypothetical protein